MDNIVNVNKLTNKFRDITPKENMLGLIKEHLQWSNIGTIPKLNKTSKIR